jgi:formiminotetrahydrofolate cyclodeaminase
LTFAHKSLEEFTAAVADHTPVPGGGAVAATTLAHGAALGAMVVAYSIGKKSFKEHEAELQAARATFGSMRIEALRLADEDAQGFEALAPLFSLAKNDPERLSALPQAIMGAIDPPRRILEVANKLVALCETLVGRSSKMLRSDLVIAARLGAVAADAAAWNVKVNLPLLAEVETPEKAHELGTTVEALVTESTRIAQVIAERCAD